PSPAWSAPAPPRGGAGRRWERGASSRPAPSSERPHLRGEVATALLEVSELIEGSAGRGEQNHLSGPNLLDCALHRRLDGMAFYRGSQVAELVADARAVLPDGQQQADPAGKKGPQRRVGGALPLTPRDPDDRPLEGPQGDQRRLDVGRLGVVDPLGPAEAPHRLQAVGQPREGGQAAGDRLGAGAAKARGQERGHGVGPPVVAAQRGRKLNVDFLGRLVRKPAHAKGAAVVECARCRRAEARKSKHAGAPAVKAKNVLVVAVEDGEVLLALMEKDPRLRLPVGLHARVAIDVIGREVGQHRHSGPEGLDPLELIARKLDHRDVSPPSFERALAKRRAQVAAREDGAARLGEQVRDEGGGGALAVGAGHAHHRLGEKAEGVLHLGEDLRAARAHRAHRGPRPRHAGRDDAEFGRRKEIGFVAAERKAHPQGQERPDRLAELGGPAAVHGPDLRSLPPKEARRSHAGPRQPQHHRPHGYLTLRLTNVISASRIETIQKRTLIFGSGQPFSSKWWWMGAIRKIRFPRSLNEATWSITETISTKKTPWRITLASSFLVSTARVPSAPPRASAPMSPMKTLAG